MFPLIQYILVEYLLYSNEQDRQGPLSPLGRKTKTKEQLKKKIAMSAIQRNKTRTCDSNHAIALDNVVRKCLSEGTDIYTSV